jgi:hypothetical protein
LFEKQFLLSAENRNGKPTTFDANPASSATATRDDK